MRLAPSPEKPLADYVAAAWSFLTTNDTGFVGFLARHPGGVDRHHESGELDATLIRRASIYPWLHNVPGVSAPPIPQIYWTRLVGRRPAPSAKIAVLNLDAK